MSSVSVVGRSGRTLLRLTAARVVGPAMALAFLGVALGALVQAAPPALPSWPLALVLLPACWAVLDPEGPAALLAVGGTATLWGIAVPQDAAGWALVAAVGLLGFHLLVAHLAAGPPGCVPAPDVLAALARAALVVAAATGLVCVVALWGAGRVTTPGIVAGVVVLLVAGLPWVVARLASTGRDEGAGA